MDAYKTHLIAYLFLLPCAHVQRGKVTNLYVCHRHGKCQYTDQGALMAPIGQQICWSQEKLLHMYKLNCNCVLPHAYKIKTCICTLLTNKS